MAKNKVAYFYDSEVGNYHFGYGHPMKPHRVRMTHELIVNYGLYQQMRVYRPHLASKEALMKFHSEPYLNFLEKITRDTIQDNIEDMKQFSVGQDCPVFEGVYDFSKICASGSIGGAERLNEGSVDIAVNWAGGLHHAKKSEASGFCYINDCVLSIIELLKIHERVLYLDIDIHHGDGVEEAFLTTNRVMTCSFHKYGDYFPGTGSVDDIGVGDGENYSINYPLNDWIDDASFVSIFKTVVGEIMTKFAPGAVVLQCGADSLAGDRLGLFNLTLRGHADCVNFVKSFKVPLMILGGGGYTMRNVARLWTYETSVLLETDISNNLPANKYFEYFGPSYKLHIDPLSSPQHKNENTDDYVQKITSKVLDILRKVEPSPSVQINTGQPGTGGVGKDTNFTRSDIDSSEKSNIEAAKDALHLQGKDERIVDKDTHVQNKGEFYDGEKDQDGQAPDTSASLQA